MNKYFSLIIIAVAYLFQSCIKEEALNPEADILALIYPENSLRTKEVEIYNDYVVVYPQKGVDLRDSIFEIEVSEGAVWEKIDPSQYGEVLYYIKVTSESGEYMKQYTIMEVSGFPDAFDFETWVKPSNYFSYETPKEGSLLWYSSNNGAAIAWNSKTKPANEYLIRKISLNQGTAVELRTMVGPGSIAGGINFIPCLAGSLYLGGFNALTGLTNPLRSTSFGVPFDNGRPVLFRGEYLFREGTEDYINPDGSTDPSKRDICTLYAVLFKTDEDVQFLYGDNVSDSPNIIARAELKSSDIVVGGSTLIPFEVRFDYDSYGTPFRWDELENNEYKLAIVFSSSSRGQHYEGRPGNTLIVDKVSIDYETIP